jgi:mono/diheme cytochrome c family protein
MSKSEKQGSGVRGRGSVRGERRRVFYCLLLTAYCLFFAASCRQDMQDQPRYEPYESSTFFKDGLSSRTPVEGTVPRGYLRADKQLFTGQNSRAQGNANNQAQTGAVATGNANGQSSGATAQNSNAGAQAGATQPANAAAQPAGDAGDAEDFPFPVTQDVMERGKERFEIFCSMCHGLTGEGDGMIVRRGYRQPPSYYEDRLRQARVGYFFRVMTEGYGAMPSYRAQVPVQDRWAIAAYIRALQLSHLNQTQGAPPVAATHGPNTEEGGGHQ